MGLIKKAFKRIFNEMEDSFDEKFMSKAEKEAYQAEKGRQRARR